LNETGPVICTFPNGLVALSTDFSMAEYLHRQLLHDVLEGPVTDYNSSTADEAEGVSYKDEEGGGTRGSDKPPLSGKEAKKAKKKAAYAKYRADKRLKAQVEQGMPGLKAINVKRIAESAQEVIQVGFSLQKDAEVTKTGWTGKQLDGMPHETATFSEVMSKNGMVHFPWDGR
jgi:hypothetical protein